MIDERLMQHGSWDLRLKPETPLQLQRRLLMTQPGTQHVIVTPTRIPTLGYDAMFDASIYSGVVLTIDAGGPDEATVIGGQNMMWHLGDTKRSPDLPRAAFTAVTTLPLVLAYLYFDDDRSAEIHYSDKGVPTTSISFEWTSDETTWSIIERWRKATDPVTEWRLLHNGTVWYAAEGDADVFVQTPTVLIARQGTLAPSVGSVRTAIADSLHRKLDFLAWVGQVYCYDSTPALTGSGWPDWPNFEYGAKVPFRSDKTMGVDLIYTYQIESASDGATGATEATALAQQIADQLIVDDWRVGTVQGIQPGVHLNVGDYVYVHDPWTGVFADNQVKWAGGEIPVEKRRVTAARWPVTDGMGVYLATSWGASGYTNPRGQTDGDFSVVDITDHVVMEPPGVSLEIGARVARPRVTTPPLWKGTEV